LAFTEWFGAKFSEDWKLVHVICKPPRFPQGYTHAWLESESSIWDPIENAFYAKEDYTNRSGEVVMRIDYDTNGIKEIIRNLKHYGPWSDELFELGKMMETKNFE
jgi:hypothetical protein